MCALQIANALALIEGISVSGVYQWGTAAQQFLTTEMNAAALQYEVNKSGTTIIAMLIMDFAPFETLSRALDQHRLGCHTIAARTRSDLCCVGLVISVTQICSTGPEKTGGTRLPVASCKAT